MKLLPEQEKDNFAKLNPAQKAVSTPMERWGNGRQRAATREPTHANLLQSVSSARGFRSKKKAYRALPRTRCALLCLAIDGHRRLELTRREGGTLCEISPNSVRQPGPFVTDSNDSRLYACVCFGMKISTRGGQRRVGKLEKICSKESRVGIYFFNDLRFQKKSL